MDIGSDGHWVGWMLGQMNIGSDGLGQLGSFQVSQSDWSVRPFSQMDIGSDGHWVGWTLGQIDIQSDGHWVGWTLVQMDFVNSGPSSSVSQTIQSVRLISQPVNQSVCPLKKFQRVN